MDTDMTIATGQFEVLADETPDRQSQLSHDLANPYDKLAAA
jgi:hypothetical protein